MKLRCVLIYDNGRLEGDGISGPRQAQNLRVDKCFGRKT